MPLCKTCGYRLKVADTRCDNCGAQVARPAGSPTAPARAAPAPLAQPMLRPEDLPKLLSPALSATLAIAATLVAGVGLMLTGYFLLKSEAAALLLPAIVLVPVLVFQRRNTALMIGLAVVCFGTGFASCAANFRWAGG